MTPRALPVSSGFWVLASLAVLCARPVRAQVRDCVSGCDTIHSPVDVTPHFNSTDNALTGSTNTVSFVVHNLGEGYDTYTLTMGCGGVTCVSQSRTSIGLPGGTSYTVYVTYTAGAPNTTGSVSLNAQTEGCEAPPEEEEEDARGGPMMGRDVVDVTCYGATGGWNVVVGPYPTITMVAPVVTSGTRVVVRNRQPIIRATFVSGATPPTALDTTQTVVTWRGENVTTLARQNRGLIEWEVDSTRWLGVGDSAQAAVSVCNKVYEGGSPQFNACTTQTIWVVLPNDQKPVLGFSGMPFEALGRQLSAPFGLGVSVHGADIEATIATPSYRSLEVARSAGLVYSTRQSYPRALVPIDVELPWPNGTANKLHLTLLDGVTRLDSLVITSPSCLTGALHRCRAVLQADFSSGSYSVPTRKWLTIQAQVDSGVTTQISTDSVEVVVVDRRTTQYGSGWWPTALTKLVAAGNDRVLVSALGTAAIYRGNGDSVYLSPPGDFTVLTKAGTGWALSPRGSLARAVFDSYGRLVNMVDQNGNADTLLYSGTSDQLLVMADPIGKRITLTYDGNGQFSTFTDPGGRQSRVTVSAATNQLTYDSIASPPARAMTSTFAYQAYSGTGTTVLTKRVGVIADTTIVAYDSSFKRRPVQATLPSVPDETGTLQRPVIAYTAYESRGYGALRSLDSVYVSVSDPRGNWTRSLLNRWGQARKSWDALGTLATVSYTPEGLVLWAEGKVPDSSRVYNKYDTNRLLVKRYIIRAVGDTLRLDTLAYDGNFRLVKRIGVAGDTTTSFYDTHGNLSWQRDGAGNVSTFYYLSNGQLDRVILPGDGGSQSRTYDAVWRNVLTTKDQSGFTTDSVLYDAYGRDTAHVNKLRVQMATGATPQWQWRRRESFYNVANQVDSTRLIRTDNCADPCTTPGSFPNDSIHSRRVGYRYDRAGRDSLRLNDRGKAALSLYDRLGRVLSRHPWTDSVAVRDTLFYDVAGNLRKSVMRRGDTLTTHYDSRNRDTLSVIPGVGTRRKAYAGPADQLTRTWYDNTVTPVVDSIGGTNGAVAWTYDLRGRLISDTTFTGATARATRYVRDSKERDSLRVDPLNGSWFVRYERARGFVDTILTPMGDTISYVFDAKSRAVGPYIRGGGPLNSRVQAWDEVGTLDSMMGRESTNPPFVTLKYDRKATFSDPQPATAPAWTEQHGAGTVVDSLQDSTSYDGCGRVVTWATRKNGTQVFTDAYSFDRDGNIYCSCIGAGRLYDVTTNRLTQTSTGIYPITTTTYGYDRAGNLVSASGGSTASYQYNALNQLTAVYAGSTLIARYAYDVLGRRIAKKVYSSATGGTVGYMRFVYEGENVAFETDEAGNVGLRYTWGGVDDLLAVDSGSTKHYYLTQDLLHTARGLVRRDGTWIVSQRYDPYGSTIARDTNSAVWVPPLRYAWTGREYDAELGLYYFRARYYSPIHLRFVQEDPIGYSGGENLYPYAGGNPLAARDPSGLRPYRDPTVSGPAMGFGGEGVSYENCYNANAAIAVDCMKDFYGIGLGNDGWYDHIWNCRGWQYLSWCEYFPYWEEQQRRHEAARRAGRTGASERRHKGGGSADDEPYARCQDFKAFAPVGTWGRWVEAGSFLSNVSGARVISAEPVALPGPGGEDIVSPINGQVKYWGVHGETIAGFVGDGLYFRFTTAPAAQTVMVRFQSYLLPSAVTGEFCLS